MSQNIHFEKATLPYRDTVFNWLDRPHVIEFWDNSPEHRQDIEIFMNGRKEPTPYQNGIFDYYIAFAGGEPFALLMTSYLNESDDMPESWRSYISKTSKTITIDFMIGCEDYYGKGYGAPTLKAFIDFLKPLADIFVIDPNINNPRAKHVYEKAGFVPQGEFERRGETFTLMVKKL